MQPIYRYPRSLLVYTSRSPFLDLLVHLEYLNSKDYNTDVLTTIHGTALNDAKARAPRIVAHARLARSYLDQSASSSDEVGLLPAYYAVLNLLKIYVLFSKRANELEANRWHGASYDVYAKDSHNLLTEVVTLRSKGAIPLVYQILTGNSIVDKTSIRLQDMYSYLADVTVEHDLATGKVSSFVGIRGTVEGPPPTRTPVVVIEPALGKSVPTLQRLKVLRNFSRDTAQVGRFKGPTTTNSGVSDDSLLRAGLRCSLLYDLDDRMTLTPVSGKRLLLPEELPIAIVFFHLSSVVRYKPEFLARIRDSKHWPLVAATRWHCLQKALLLLWRHVQQTSVFMSTP